ncbi:hypothetical protein ACI2JN_24405 [Ochrobactrum teleogrylli]|uniref:hypothetical protein n=1 Tax=Ochrobactrum teleogrylli TaxID=2479765 RepID=UPI00384C1C2A
MLIYGDHDNKRYPAVVNSPYSEGELDIALQINGEGSISIYMGITLTILARDFDIPGNT